MVNLERVLVVGGGGREVALMAEAIQAGVGKVYSTRGEDAVNFGIEGVNNTGLGDVEIQKIGSFASLQDIDLVVVGPEAPLVGGLADLLRNRGVPVFGPGADGAQFEANKAFTHQFALDHDLPNPHASQTFTPDQRDAAKDLIRELGEGKVYTKRVGLEGGKGAVGYEEGELDKALKEVDAVADKGEALLIQGRLRGPEFSATYILDGKGRAVATELSRDHKSLYDGGLGANTGGLGAFAPLSFDQAHHARRAEIEDIGHRIAGGLVEDNIDYRGVIYAGLMANEDTAISPLKLLEINVRFGDPEAEVILPGLDGHAMEYMLAAARGSLETDMTRLYRAAGERMVRLTVCLASPGYGTGGDILTGLPIFLPDSLPDDVSIQFAGAKMIDGKPYSTGGRVVYITKEAPTIAEARGVYDLIGRENGGLYLGDDQQHTRTDVGLV